MQSLIMTDDQLEDFVVGLVVEYGVHMPFHLLVEEIQETLKVDFSGEFSIASPADPDIVVWPGLDAILVDAVNSAVRKERIYLVPALAREYAADGVDLRRLGYTVADLENAPAKRGKPIWAPMTLSAVPVDVKPPPFMTPAEVEGFRNLRHPSRA